jgi:hypothetical protein
VIPEQFKERMSKIANGPGDTEGDHADADDLMCELLRELGYGEEIDIYLKMPKWYA